MKKHLLFFAVTMMCLLSAQAATYTIQVANYQFTPSTVNANVGDTIIWTWASGGHTTTCDPANFPNTSLPAGADIWDKDINETSTSFSYKLTVAGTYNYICIPHARGGMIGTINVSAVLPVTLLSFIAAAQDNKALLKWTVANEQNVSYYAIQKSTDGKTFTEAGRISATGTVAAQKTYTYTDNTTAANKYIYYSLKIMDKDGKAQQSPVALYKNESIKSGIIVSMSPNPISSPGHLMLQFNADKPGTMLVQLFDANGRVVKQASMMAVTGINNGHFHLGELPAGAYTIVFSIDGKKETKRLQFE